MPLNVSQLRYTNTSYSRRLVSLDHLNRTIYVHINGQHQKLLFPPCFSDIWLDASWSPNPEEQPPAPFDHWKQMEVKKQGILMKYASAMCYSYIGADSGGNLDARQLWYGVINDQLVGLIMHHTCLPALCRWICVKGMIWSDEFSCCHVCDEEGSRRPSQRSKAAVP